MRDLLCLAVSLVLLATDARGEDRLKAFLNVSAPETALHAPVVFTFHGKTVLVGLYMRATGRDVSAMVLQGKQWQPLGENGLSISGVKGNFLSGVAADEDENLWVLTYYTRPSNADRADRFFLYRLRKNRWTLVGSPNGLKADFSGDAAIHLRNGITPILTYQSYDRSSKSYRKRVFELRNGDWKEAQIDPPIPPRSMIATCDHHGFLVRVEDGQILMTDLADLERGGASPKYRVAFPRTHRLGRIYFRANEPLAIIGRNAKSSRTLFRYSKPQNGVISSQTKLPDDKGLIGIRWDDLGRLYVATSDVTTVKVHRRDAHSWTLISTAMETSGAELFAPSFTMLDNNTPLVTWEAFFPH